VAALGAGLAFGYGYPFWNIYGPLAYFVGEGVLRLGFETIDATKIVFALSVLGSARRCISSCGGCWASRPG